MACALFLLLTVALAVGDEGLRFDEGSLAEVALSVEMVLFRSDTEGSACSELLTAVASSVEMVMLFRSDTAGLCSEVLTEVAPSCSEILTAVSPDPDSEGGRENVECRSYDHFVASAVVIR